MNSSFEINSTITEWADTVVQIWINQLLQLGINNAYQHAQSFEWHAYNAAGGNIAKVTFVFEYFLKFTDMGVGRGVSLEDRKYLIHNKRKQKPWYSKTFLLEVKKLQNILADKYARLGALTIIENLSDNALAWDKSAIKI